MRNILTIYRRALRAAVAILATAGAVLPSAALAYEITYLGTYGTSFVPTSINDEGWVAGTNNQGQATLFAGRLRMIKTATSSARAVNNSGDIVGSFSLPDPSTGVTTTHAFRHRDTINGAIVDDLGSAANSAIANSNYSEAYGINTSGQVVGFARVQVASAPVKYEDHAFLYNDRMIDLALFVGKDHYAYDINDSGDIVGEYKTSGGVSHAFLRTNDGLMNPDLPLIGTSSVACAVNNLGHVVGNYTKDGFTHAFLFAGGSLKDLGTLPGDTASYALDINDKDQIVGYSVSASGVMRAFLYDGAMTDLSTALATTSVATLRTATAINNKGEMAVETNYTNSGYVGYRLSPTLRLYSLEHPKIPAPHNALSDYGKAVAISGDAMVVGAPSENSGAGAAHVYQFKNGWWTKTQTLTATTPKSYEGFGTTVAIDGAMLVIGVPNRNVSGNYIGTVQVFEHTSSGWQLSSEIPSTSPTSNGSFGISIAVRNNVIAVGSNSGAYVANLSNGVWTLQQLLAPSDKPAGGFGAAVAYYGDTIVVDGSVYSPGGISCFCPSNYHYAYVYEWTGIMWSHIQTFPIGSIHANSTNYFGKFIVSTNRIVVGSSYGEVVSIYERAPAGSPNSWVLSDQVTPFGSAPPAAGSRARSLALSGELLIVGNARLGPSGYLDSGDAYIYEHVGPYWVDRIKITSSDRQEGNQFGNALAISLNTLAVGTNFQAGGVYVFSLCSSACQDIFSADIALNVSATTDKVAVLGKVTLNIVVTNNDVANTANGVTVEIRSPNASSVSGPGECTNTLDKIVCRIASLGPGQSAPVLNVTLTAPGATGAIVTEVQVKTTGPDPDPANNVRSITTEVTPLGEPSINITGLTHLSADKTTVVLADDDTVSVSFVLGSIQLSSSGNKVVVQLDQDLVANQASSAPVILDRARLSQGPHTVTVMVLDAKNIEVVRDSLSFTVKLLLPGVILKRPQSNEVIECGLNETVLMDYLTPHWSVAPKGKYLEVILDQRSTPYYTPQVELNLCDSFEGEHVLELRLINAAGVIRQTVTAAFTVRRVSPNVVLTLPKEGGRYLRGFDMVYEFMHTTPGTRALLILNDAPPQGVDIQSRTLAIAAEQLLPEKNRIVLQLFDGDRPLPQVERVFYVQDAASDASAPSTKSGGGAADVLLLLWMVVVLSFRLRRAMVF